MGELTGVLSCAVLSILALPIHRADTNLTLKKKCLDSNSM
jgi:hypothetical protein